MTVESLPTFPRAQLLKLLKLQNECTRPDAELQALYEVAHGSPCKVCTRPKYICGGERANLNEELGRHMGKALAGAMRGRIG